MTFFCSMLALNNFQSLAFKKFCLDKTKVASSQHAETCYSSDDDDDGNKKKPPTKPNNATKPNNVKKRASPKKNSSPNKKSLKMSPKNKKTVSQKVLPKNVKRQQH